MESKKNPDKDINKRRLLYSSFGFAISSAIVFLVFSFKNVPQRGMPQRESILIDQVEKVVNTQQSAYTPPPPVEDLSIVNDEVLENTPIASTEFNEKDKISPNENTDLGQEKDEKFDDSEPYRGVLEKQFYFKGGEDAMFEFLHDELVYPSSAKEDGVGGVVNVTFIIEKDGSVSHISTSGKGDRELEAEAKRVIERTSGMWVPAETKNRKVRVICIIPITFNINN